MPGYPPARGSYQSTDGEYELLETDNVGSAPTTRHALDLSEVRANGTERNRTSDGLSTADRTPRKHHREKICYNPCSIVRPALSGSRDSKKDSPAKERDSSSSGG